MCPQCSGGSFMVTFPAWGGAVGNLRPMSVTLHTPDRVSQAGAPSCPTASDSWGPPSTSGPRVRAVAFSSLLPQFSSFSFWLQKNNGPGSELGEQPSLWPWHLSCLLLLLTRGPESDRVSRFPPCLGCHTFSGFKKPLIYFTN